MMYKKNDSFWKYLEYYMKLKYLYGYELILKEF